MKTNYVCRSHINLYENFHNNRTMWSTNLHVKICRWGEKEKEPESRKEILLSIPRVIAHLAIIWENGGRFFSPPPPPPHSNKSFMV